MAGLLEHQKSDDAPEAAQAAPTQAPEAPQPEAPVRACATCSQPLADGQDWCLECGSAQPGRLGGRPGWRAALSVLAVTAVLVGGAGAAAYAALTTEAQRSASADAPPAATPQIAQPPVQAVPGAEDEDTPSVDAPDSESADVPEAKGDAEDSGDGGDDAPDVSGGSSVPAPSSGSGAPDTPDAGSGTGAPSSGTPVELPKGAAAVYNPYGRPTGGITNPARAIDGKTSTAWEAPVGGDGRVQTGVVISLEKTTALSALEYRADTPGFNVEVYATRAENPPPDILDARWEHPASQRDSDVTERVALDGRYRHVLLWVTEQPADTKAAIAEIQLFQ